MGKSYTESEYQAVLATIPPLERLWAPKADLPSFTTVMGFNGSPEIINGRLAMMGFVAAVGAELSSGEFFNFLTLKSGRFPLPSDAVCNFYIFTLI